MKVQKTNAARLLDKEKIDYSLVPYQVDEEHLDAIHVADQLGEAGEHFVRLGRKLIINTDYLYSIDISRQSVVLSDCRQFRKELSASREVLTRLKAYVDASILNYDG